MQKQVSLDPGQSTRVSFQIAPTAAGTYSVTLDGLQGQFTASALPTPQVAVSEFFVGTTLKPNRTSADDRLYIAIKNTGQIDISGVLNVYDWQAWWETEDERRWRSWQFSLAPGAVYRNNCGWSHMAFDGTYIRAEVLVGGIKVAETPKVYIVPGKIYSGSEKIAVGECTHKAPGLAVLWYSQYSVTDTWRGNYRTPADPPYLHYRTFSLTTKDYNSNAWPGVFLAMIDPNFIRGAQYKAYILGGSTAWRDVHITFTM